MTIDPNVIDVLRQCSIDSTLLRFPGELDRKLYEKTAKVLKSIGGKWSSAKKAFVFKDDVGDIVAGIVDNGEFTPDNVKYQFFPTPDALAAKLVELAAIRPGEICLEPSAGRGAIARHLPNPMCVELDPKNREYLKAEGFNVVAEDFMTFEPDPRPDVIVMNPPFCKNQDAKHIARAIEMAKRCVVAVASQGLAWKNESHCAYLRNIVSEYGGYISPLPDGSFKESGTDVHAVIVFVEKH